MDIKTGCHKAERYLHVLCEDIGSRRVGSQENKAATSYLKAAVESMGLLVETQRFDCQDHKTGEIDLSADGLKYEAQISPHSPGCDLIAELTTAASLEELRDGECRGKILLMMGDLTQEQLMPKNFVFYNPDSHKEIYRLLESKQPAAILAATGRNPELAGAPYPFPLIEDGDFDIPSAFLTDVEGAKLAGNAGNSVHLAMQAERIPSWAENVIIRRAKSSRDRLVVCAHIDTKAGTPGAVDNGSGIVVLMLLAELLRDAPCSLDWELVAFNGEDHYSVGGEMAYLRENQGKLDTIKLAINVDGAGFRDHSTSVSFYECPQVIEKSAVALTADYPSIEKGEPWPQSDHMVFVMNQVPAMAVTTAAFMQMEREIAHTQKDKIDRVDTQLLAEIAFYLKDLVSAI